MDILSHHVDGGVRGECMFYISTNEIHIPYCHCFMPHIFVDLVLVGRDFLEASNDVKPPEGAVLYCVSVSL